jgi:hypothetical protein
MKCPHKDNECKQLDTSTMTKKVQCSECDWKVYLVCTCKSSNYTKTDDGEYKCNDCGGYFVQTC